MFKKLKKIFLTKRKKRKYKILSKDLRKFCEMDFPDDIAREVDTRVKKIFARRLKDNKRTFMGCDYGYNGKVVVSILEVDNNGEIKIVG